VVVVSRPQRRNLVVGEPDLLTEDVKFARERERGRGRSCGRRGATAAELGRAGPPTRFAIESSVSILS
jgi:hypothetical protein